MLSSAEMMPLSTTSRITKRHGACMTPAKHDPEPVIPQCEGAISTRDLRTCLREWRTWHATVATREKADDEEFLRLGTHTGVAFAGADAG